MSGTINSYRNDELLSSLNFTERQPNKVILENAISKLKAAKGINKYIEVVYNDKIEERVTMRNPPPIVLMNWKHEEIKTFENIHKLSEYLCINETSIYVSLNKGNRLQGQYRVKIMD